jgi:hypothetical protein
MNNSKCEGHLGLITPAHCINDDLFRLEMKMEFQFSLLLLGFTDD